ncbi:MAG: arginine repressor [Chloroherpetonaceae bacterium]|nr:arginine repressor [Chloroherpetonaceae bacterium]MDW8438590.1 arginine repressor [Chloroherpetonaceae bacterium]
MGKAERQLAIKEIISTKDIASQEELAKELLRKGFEVNQATLSRDMKELGIAKVITADGVWYQLQPDNEAQRLKMLLAYEIESIQSNDCMVVVKTLRGRASGVAEILDRLQIPDILGTIAGDDTIFIAPTSSKKIPVIVKRIKEAVLQSEEK